MEQYKEKDVKEKGNERKKERNIDIQKERKRKNERERERNRNTIIERGKENFNDKKGGSAK